MKPDQDDALRAALADAHRADAQGRPAFHKVWGTAQRAGRPRHSAAPWLVTCATLATAAGLAVWLVGRLGPPPAHLPMGTTWKGPTDFLLETPGLVTLQTVPSLVPTLPNTVMRPDSDARRAFP